MVEKETEKVGCETPWDEINRLLKAHERFDVQCQGEQTILLAPKTISTLAALVYLLSQKNIPYHIQGRGTTGRSGNKNEILILSTRSLNHFSLDEEGIVELGAGCSLFELSSFLAENKYEVSLEGSPLTSLKSSIGGILLSGRVAGYRLRKESFIPSLLGLEFVTFQGDLIKWGGDHLGGSPGPALHHMLGQMDPFPGILTKVIGKAYPRPEKRLNLTWHFHSVFELGDYLTRLRVWTHEWERLDAVISGCEGERSYLFAQISGQAEEMDAFQHACPYAHEASHDSMAIKLMKFFVQQKLKAYSYPVSSEIKSGDYLWVHALDNKAWKITADHVQQRKEERPLWKARLWDCLDG